MKKKKKSKIYFTKQTERQIVKYNSCDDPVERNKIFNEHLEYPFMKIAENLINKYKFPYFEQFTEDLQEDVVAYMITKIHKYDAEKGAAFSYFSVMARNHLVAGNKEYYARVKQHHRIDDPDLGRDIIDEADYKKTTSDSEEFFELLQEFWENNVDIIFPRERDNKIAKAIMELFRRADFIENFNKKYLYVLIREQTDVRTQYITGIVNKMREYVEKLLVEYHKNGIFDTSPRR